MGKKVNFDLGNAPGGGGSNPDPLTVALANKIDAIVKWAKVSNTDMEQLRGMVYSLIASFETLAGLLEEGKDITSEAISAGRNTLLDEWTEKGKQRILKP